MYKPKDNDIFGTSQVGFAPRITNNSHIDPNAAFKRRTEQNYDNYTSTVQQMRCTITARPADTCKVNENAQFEEDYHRQRKDRDLKSTIFYESKHKAPQPVGEDQENQSTIANRSEMNFGKKETLNREINQLPYNNSSFKGNESRLFDLDTRSNADPSNREPLIPLIPHQMEWDQHDSIKYACINESRQSEVKQMENIGESQSTVFEPIPSPQAEGAVPQEKEVESVEFKPPAMPEKEKERVKSGQIEILVMGWQNKFMEGLSKHVKLNKSAIVKFLVHDEKKLTLVLKKSQRWENVTDWLRKDCKLKIRVFH